MDNTDNTVNMDNTENNLEKISELFVLLKKHKWDDFIEKINNENVFDINITDEYNNYLLTYAVLFNKPDIVNLLIDKGARIDIVDSDNRSILYIVIHYNYDEILDILLNVNSENIGISIIDIADKNGTVPLHYCVIFNNINALKKLLSYGASTNVADNKGYNALHMAVYMKSLTMTKLIIEQNVDVNSRCNSGETALHIACNLQLIEIVKILLNNNINVNIQDYDHEFTALHYSVNLNNRDIVKLLLNNGADPNIQDMVGNTAVHYCVNENNIECLNIIMYHPLFKGKINVNLWNFQGYIPLHIVLESTTNSTNLINEYFNLLLEGSNLNIQNNDGDTCLHLICKNNIWQEFIKELKKKKLDIFILNLQKMRPIDYIRKNELEAFLDVVIHSYLYRLRNKNTIWEHEWQNMCKKELYPESLTNEQNEIIKSLVTTESINKQKKTKNKDDICYDIIKSQLEKMINLKDVTICSKSFPTKQGNMCIKMIEEGTSLNFCTFTGSTLDILVSLVYLLKKFPDACSTFSRNFSENKDLCKFYKSIGIIMNVHCEFLNFEIVWVYQKLYLTDDFFENFKKCINKKDVRFIIMPLGIEMREGSHANYLIYDKKNNEIERFEPHGSSPPTGLNYNPTLLDNILESKFKEINANIKYISPKDYLPRIGFQLLDVSERKKKKIGDPGGFCALWVVWYVDMRLTYKNLDRTSLVKQMIKSIKSQNVSFKNLIRNYAKNIIDIRDKILGKAGIDINDWLNDQFNEKQINIIIEELRKEISVLI